MKKVFKVWGISCLTFSMAFGQVFSLRATEEASPSDFILSDPKGEHPMVETKELLGPSPVKEELSIDSNSSLVDPKAEKELSLEEVKLALKKQKLKAAEEASKTQLYNRWINLGYLAVLTVTLGTLVYLMKSTVSKVGGAVDEVVRITDGGVKNLNEVADQKLSTLVDDTKKLTEKIAFDVDELSSQASGVLTRVEVHIDTGLEKSNEIIGKLNDGATSFSSVMAKSDRKGLSSLLWGGTDAILTPEKDVLDKHGEMLQVILMEMSGDNKEKSHQDLRKSSLNSLFNHNSALKPWFPLGEGKAGPLLNEVEKKICLEVLKEKVRLFNLDRDEEQKFVLYKDISYLDRLLRWGNLRGDTSDAEKEKVKGLAEPIFSWYTKYAERKSEAARIERQRQEEESRLKENEERLEAEWKRIEDERKALEKQRNLGEQKNIAAPGNNLVDNEKGKEKEKEGDVNALPAGQ